MVSDFKLMKRKDLQRLCVQKHFKANGTNNSMRVALEASICSDMAMTGGGSAAVDGGDGMVLDFKSMNHKDLQRLCVQKKLKANGTTVSMAAALEAFRCSVVAVTAGRGVAKEDDKDV